MRMPVLSYVNCFLLIDTSAGQETATVNVQTRSSSCLRVITESVYIIDCQLAI